MTTPFVIRRETDNDKSEYYNKQAAQERQKKIDEDVAAFLAGGGKVTKLESYGELGSSGGEQSIYGKGYRI